MSADTFVYVTYIATTPQRVWDALLEGALTRQYWQHENVSDWKPGSNWASSATSAQHTVRHVGKVLECLPNKRLVMTWAEPSDAGDPAKHSRVAIDMELVGEMVRLTVTHDELSPEMHRKITSGWPRVLSSLKSFLETGRPLDVFGCSTSTV